MQNADDASKPLDALMEDLLESSEEYVLPEKRLEFERSVNLALLIIETLVADPVDIFKDLGGLLQESEEYIVREKREDFARRVKLALLSSKVALIETLSKETSKSEHLELTEIDKKWRALRAKSQALARRLQLLSPTTQEEFEATLMWMAELGRPEDLDLLRHMESDPPFSSENIKYLLSAAKGRIHERHIKPYDDLLSFYALNWEKFSRAAGIGDKGTNPQEGVPVTSAMANLQQIKESLEGMFTPEEAQRWLHSPNAILDGKTPVEVIVYDQSNIIVEILIALEEGIPN